MAVDKDEETNHTYVVEDEERWIRVSTEGTGRRAGDEEEEDERANPALLFGAREELGHLVRVRPLRERAKTSASRV